MVNDKKPAVPVEDDVAMKDAEQDAKKDAAGDVEMGDVVKSGESDKKDDEKVEDPVVTTSNGRYIRPTSSLPRLPSRLRF
jgi:hypothetical protein